MEREIRTVLEFNFSAFSINLGNMPQEQDRHFRILIAASKKAITRKWPRKGIPSVSEGDRNSAGNVSRNKTTDLFSEPR